MPPPPAFDYYEALEIDRTATTEEIKSSYRRLARVHHPDKNLDNPDESTAAFQKVNCTQPIFTSYNTSQDLLLTSLNIVDPDSPRNPVR
jgi:preprotein translocase subunit Sec63